MWLDLKDKDADILFSEKHSVKGDVVFLSYAIKLPDGMEGCSDEEKVYDAEQMIRAIWYEKRQLQHQARIKKAKGFG